MARYYILIKRKGTKRWIGAIPARKGITKAKLQSATKKNIKTPYTFRIITEAQLKRSIISKMAKRRTRKKQTPKKRRVRRSRRSGHRKKR